MTSAPRIKTLLLDLDGTLVGMRTKRTQLHFVLGTLSQWRYEIPTWKAVGALRAVNQAMRKPSLDRTNAERAVDAFAKVTGLSHDTAAIKLLRTMEQVFPELKSYFYPMPGAAEFVRWAYERYSLILATNPVWMREIIEYRVRWAGVDPAMFRFVTHAGVMHALKPLPEYYREILQRNELDPAECLMIGNEVVMDQPAQRVGLPVFLVTPGLSHAVPKEPGVWKGDFHALRRWLEESAS